MPKNKQDTFLTREDFLSLLDDYSSKNYEDPEEKKTISITPTTAVMGLIGIIFVLVQFMIGFGMWSIQDRLARYDSYEQRITKMEQSIIKMDYISEEIAALRKDFATYSGFPKFTESDFTNKMNAILAPITTSISTIEKNMNEKIQQMDKEFNKIQIEMDKRSAFIDNTNKRLVHLEQELEISKRLRQK